MVAMAPMMDWRVRAIATAASRRRGRPHSRRNIGPEAWGWGADRRSRGRGPGWLGRTRPKKIHTGKRFEMQARVREKTYTWVGGKESLTNPARLKAKNGLRFRRRATEPKGAREITEPRGAVCRAILRWGGWHPPRAVG